MRLPSWLLPSTVQPQSGVEPSASQSGLVSRQLLVWVGPGLLLAIYAVFLSRHFAAAIYGPDDNGYFAQGSLLAATGRTWFRLDSNVQYVGLHWLLGPQGRYFSRYPPGLAVPVALLCHLFSPETSLVINPVLAWLGLLGFFLLVRMQLGHKWALAAVALLMVSAEYNRHAIVCDAHMAVTVLLIWGFYLLLRWSQGFRLRHLFPACLLLACIPTVRYGEAIYALGAGIFFFWHLRACARKRLHLLVAAGAVLLPIVPLLVRNLTSFGSCWRTAYAYTNEQSAFGWGFFKGNFLPYLRVLQTALGLFLALGMIGLILLSKQRKHRAEGWAWSVIVVSTTLFYMAYYWAPNHMIQGTVRFLLPIFPFLFFAGLWTLKTLLAQESALLRHGTVVLVVVVQALLRGAGSFDECQTLHYQKQVLYQVSEALAAVVPRNAVVLAHQKIEQHLDFLRRWRLADLTLLAGVRVMEGTALPVAGAPQPGQMGKRRVQSERYDRLPPALRENAFADDLRVWAGDQRIFYVGTEAEIQAMPGRWFNPGNFKILAHVPVPPPPTGQRREGGQGAAVQQPVAASGAGASSREPMGGIMRDSFDFLRNDTELVVAEWTPPFREPGVPGDPPRPYQNPFPK